MQHVRLATIITRRSVVYVLSALAALERLDILEAWFSTNSLRVVSLLQELPRPMGSCGHAAQPVAIHHGANRVEWSTIDLHLLLFTPFTFGAIHFLYFSSTFVHYGIGDTNYCTFGMTATVMWSCSMISDNLNL
jgi:hypothetical protein